mmetsp:Transcript_15425/g.27341  ORF Transcript_15425/g.27341 Transcript_15425/m.27341 type:complete len:108 (-) Transcript_15425:1305-1628(-)
MCQTPSALWGPADKWARTDRLALDLTGNPDREGPHWPTSHSNGAGACFAAPDSREQLCSPRMTHCWTIHLLDPTCTGMVAATLCNPADLHAVTLLVPPRHAASCARQ